MESDSPLRRIQYQPPLRHTVYWYSTSLLSDVYWYSTSLLSGVYYTVAASSKAYTVQNQPPLRRILIEEVLIQKTRQTVVISVWGARSYAAM